MLYAMQHGRSEQKILDQCYQERMSPPKFILEAPELHLGLEFTYGAFLDLSGDRQIGMGPGPIPWSAVMDYGGAYELTWEETEDLAYLIRRMDEAFLAEHDKIMRRK